MGNDETFLTNVNTFDSERNAELNYYFIECNNAIYHWQLEKAYQDLRAIDRISSGFLKDDEEKEAKTKFNKIEKIRRIIKESSSEKVIEEQEILLKHEIEETYKFFNRKASGKGHGLFFVKKKERTSTPKG